MNPAFLDEMSWAMSEVYAAVTDRILINLAHHFPYIKPGQKIPGSFEYQARMLAQMGQVNKETVEIIAQSLAGADEALKGVLTAAITEALKDEEPKLRRAAEKGLLQGGGFLPPEVTPNQMQAFRYYYRQSADKLNLVNTVMLESTQAAYSATVADITSKVAATQSILNTAAGEVITGVSTWNQAVKTSVNKMVENGLTGFVDHGGHHWSPEAYVAMDVRTTTFNTAREAVWERNEDYGNDLYQVSSHNGARPLCYPWQGKVISRTDWVREVEDLDGGKITVIAQSETSYGEAAGLFGVNCRHYPMTFIPGFSTLKGEPQSPEENEKTYAESQEQRRLERKLREEKRDLDVMKAQGSPESEIKAQRERVKAASQDIDDFCDSTGRTRRRNREGAPISAKFPNPDTYDVTDFPTAQRDQMREFYGGKPQQTPAQVEPEKPTFTPAKTRAEAETYAREHFADTVDFTGMSLENANKVNETLTTLTEKYPINRLDHITQQQIGAVARANHDHLEISGKKLGKVLADEELNFKIGLVSKKMSLQEIKRRYEGKAKIPFDAQQKIDKLENNLKYSRYGVHSSYDDHVRAVITHEYGHILSDQYFGMINHERGNPNYVYGGPLWRMNERWRVAYTQAVSSGDIHSLSQYGSKNAREFFAESFAAREMGETLPDYVEELLSEVLNNGIM